MASVHPGDSRMVIGAVFARRWRLALKVGEGGMGEVFAADPIEGGPRVALKVLRPEFVGDPQVRSRFLAEARTSTRLVHPNVVRVIEGTEDEDGAPYLVMELLDGVPLGAYTANGGRVPLAQAVPILQGILSGLGAAHAHGIVHRDLKPDNVFLTRDGRGAFVVKLLDFGIAKVMDAAGGMRFRTRTGVLLGTPAYMSPEQAKNARDVDQRADLWSAGVLFYEMVTGRAAFTAPTEYARLAAILSSEVEPADRIDPALAPLASFFERALKKDRTERFSSALEMSQALAMALPGIGARGSGAPAGLGHLPETVAMPGSPPTVTHPVGPYEIGLNPPPPAAHSDEGNVALPALAPGGTLNSPASPAISEIPANVVVAPRSPSFGALGETLSSRSASKDGAPKRPQDGDALRSRSVSAVLAIALALGALVAGFLLGVAYSRM